MQRLSRIASNEGITFHGPDREITGITADSRNVKPGFLFIAIPGAKHDGTAFIAEAVARGAVAVLAPESTTLLPDTTILTTSDIRRAVSAVAAAFYPRQPETIIAVTGTSGKTSTAQFTREIWQSMGHGSASIGTLGLVKPVAQSRLRPSSAERVSGAESSRAPEIETRYGSLTTPDAITLHQLLDECAGQGISHLAMEASSHGLALHRLDHVRLKAGGFTNLSRDHLDYHETMEAYLAAKLRLYKEVMPAGSAAVLNADIPEFASLADMATSHQLKVISYGKNAKDIRLLDITPDVTGQILHIETLGNFYKIPLPLIGSFQAWNALCALGLVIGSGGNVEKAVAGASQVTGVPGRLQMVGTSATGGAVFVDYAHKPDALDNVLRALRPHVAAHAKSQKGRAKLGVVFGCGGNRDKGKRPLMGEIATRLADWVIVTDDNPRHEEPAAIRRAILAGCRAGAPLQEIGDRAQAIEAGIGKLGQGDILVIAGKGHEHGQIIGDETHPFDDAEVARKVL